jgi:tol-pal system protein YbgF
MKSYSRLFGQSCVGAAMALGSLAPFGCARSAEDRQLDAMRAEIDNVRDPRDPRARGGSGARGDGEPNLVVPQEYTSAAVQRPPPSVVQLGEARVDDGQSADPQDTTPRPVIRVFGSVHASIRGPRGDDRIEQTGADDATGTPGATGPRDGLPIDPEAKPAYDAALALVNAKRFDEALDALTRFLVKWPDHPYADHAMYWRGECYYSRGDYARAVEQFEGVVARFPAGSKAPDALLKLGMSQQKLGNAAKARETFARLSHQYSDSEAARHIPSGTVAGPPPAGPAPEERR